MKTRTYNIGDYTFEFAAYSASTRSGFKHVGQLTVYNGYACTEYNQTRYYYNRTWEYWRYQSVMKDCLYNYIDTLTALETEAFKHAKGYKRMNEKRREEFKQWESYPREGLSAADECMKELDKHSYV